MLENAPAPADVCAVIVTYLPDEGFPTRLERITAQFPRTIIVDNSGSDEANRRLRITSDAASRIKIILNPKNLGVAVALNQGVKQAEQLGFRWVITLDQDSDIAADMVEAMTGAYKSLNIGLALLGANYWDTCKDTVAVACRHSIESAKERKTVITSGCLLPIPLYRDIGPFREDYFIDSVDHEYCLRARSHGYRVFITCHPLMHQTVGRANPAQCRLQRSLARSHSATRKYFMARNTLATAKIFALREPVWALCQCLRLLAEAASVLFYEEQRAGQLRAIVVGALHGLQDRLGPIEKAWPNGAA